jgi:uncharacterized protein
MARKKDGKKIYRQPISRKIFFVNGLMDSVGYMFHKNGTLAAEIGYRNNQPDGRATFYEEDGRLFMKFHLVDGERGTMIVPKNSTEVIFIGKHITYTHDKKIRTKTTYDQNGKLNGLFTPYFNNGTIEKEIQYVHGEIDGFYKEYYETGILKTETYYKAGKLMKEISCFSKKGRLIPCG